MAGSSGRHYASCAISFLPNKLENFDSPTELPLSGTPSVGCAPLCDVAPSATPAPTKRAGVLRNIVEAQNRERRLLVREISKVKGLMPLMMKPRNGMRWTEEERTELLMQLRALMSLSPYLAVLALPGSVLLLPLLAWFIDRRRMPRKKP